MRKEKIVFFNTKVNMVITKEYSEAMTEVIDILKHMDEDLIEKIPMDFIKMLNKYKSNNYIPNIDYSDPNKIKNINKKTEAFLAIIYKDYLCDEDEKIEFEKMLMEKQNKKKSKNDYENKIITAKEKGIKEILDEYPDEILENNNANKSASKLPISIKKESIFRRILKKIFKIG